jgi:hypothetical protein
MSVKVYSVISYKQASLVDKMIKRALQQTALFAKVHFNTLLNSVKTCLKGTTTRKYEQCYPSKSVWDNLYILALMEQLVVHTDSGSCPKAVLMSSKSHTLPLQGCSDA